VNRVICSNISPGKFITFFYCLLDAEKKRLSYTNAGHNPPILLRRDKAPIRLEEGGAVLGVFRDWNFKQAEVELESGDVLVLYTDGATEINNSSEEEFGEERLIETAMKDCGTGAAQLHKSIMKAVVDFGGNDFQDDVTLIVMSVE